MAAGVVRGALGRLGDGEGVRRLVAFVVLRAFGLGLGVARFVALGVEPFVPEGDVDG